MSGAYLIFEWKKWNIVYHIWTIETQIQTNIVIARRKKKEMKINQLCEIPQIRMLYLEKSKINIELDYLSLSWLWLI